MTETAKAAPKKRAPAKKPAAAKAPAAPKAAEKAAPKAPAKAAAPAAPKAAEKAAPKAPAKAAAPAAPAVPADLTAALSSLNTMEVPEIVRSAAEEGIAKAREAYDKARTAADEAKAAAETYAETQRQNLLDMNTKAAEAMRDNTAALFGFYTELASAKNLSDVIALQADFGRKQLDVATEQATAFQDLAKKAAEEAAEPIKAGVSKVMQDIRA